MYEKLFGLSCVENHVLAILRQRKEQIGYTYFDCAVPLKDLYEHMVVQGVKQEYFHLTERIQDVLKKLGVIELVKEKTKCFQELEEVIFSCKEDEYFLIKVTPEFTKKQLFARGFREDHFVYVRAFGSQFQVFNDIPKRDLMLSPEQLKKGFDGKYFRLFVHRKLCEEDKNLLWNMRKFRPEKETVFSLQRGVDSDIEDIGIKLRNLTGVYKQLRYRMKAYYGNYTDTGLFRKQCRK